MSYEKLPRSCRYCAEMVCGDVNYCERKGITVSDEALPKVRKCLQWRGNDMAADSFEVWKPKERSRPKECDGQEAMKL